MTESIVLKEYPRIEFQLLDSGFRLSDGRTEGNSGLYAYSDLQSIELNKTWFPIVAKCLRAITWIVNGVPYFPDAETCKKANLIIHFGEAKLGVWLTDSKMAKKAKLLKKLLDEKSKNSIV